ncbi:UMP kinase [Candidatus Woesearchaeota archaeon]|nr:UMP kinase [Candidatus Woesearchaeota archaeon]
MKVIISLGGSLIYPEQLDIDFLKQFKTVIEEYVKKGHSFVIFCGGGRLARNYQKAASEMVDLNDEQKDWIGIQATKMNAVLVRSLFKDVYAKIVKDPTEKIDTDKKIIVCSGWKPGWSTDFDAVMMAKNLKAQIIVNMSNIDFVYDKDPKKADDAKPITVSTWDDFKKIVGTEWIPGLNTPFDPIATQKAADYGLTVIIIGKNLDNLKKILEGKEFDGTTIK